MPCKCPHCSREFTCPRINSRHLAKCRPDLSVAPVPCLCGHVSTSQTQMHRHQQGCTVWAGRNRTGVAVQRRRETSLQRYGVLDASHAPEVNAKRERTNQERYGATNPFSRQASTFGKVQKALVGKRPIFRGQDNAFAQEEVKTKIRATLMHRYGADNPQKCSAIRLRTRATNLARFGVAETLSAPVIRERIRQTCESVYGGSGPGCSSAVREKMKATNLARYGQFWTTTVPQFRARQLATQKANYGGYFFASQAGKDKIRAVLVRRYGVPNAAQIPGVTAKRTATYIRRYGAKHPLQLAHFNEKRYRTCLRKYGSPFPGLCATGPNLLEKRIATMCPCLLFTGDGTYWKFLPHLQAYKNPDFVLPSGVPGHPFRGVKKVVEVFGNFWHSPRFTGKPTEAHEKELIQAFVGIGIQCLVIWETDINRDPETTKRRLKDFLANARFLPDPAPVM